MAESASADCPDASAAADAFEERSAIVEFDAGIPRAWAEGFAALQCAQAPVWTALRPGMWPDLINAVGLILDRWGRQAAELGWDPIDLFGALPRAGGRGSGGSWLAFNPPSSPQTLANGVLPAGFQAVRRRQIREIGRVKRNLRTSG